MLQRGVKKQIAAAPVRPVEIGVSLGCMHRSTPYGGLANGHALNRHIRACGSRCGGCCLLCDEAGETPISTRGRPSWRPRHYRFKRVRLQRAPHATAAVRHCAADAARVKQLSALSLAATTVGGSIRTVVALSSGYEG